MELEIKDFLKCTNEYNTINVSDKIFRYPFKPNLIHQIVSSYLINSRRGTKSQKSRSEVSGSNRKPWRQKGTGRARSGSIKSPIWRSGGVTFASTPKLYTQKINKKMYKNAIRSILSKLVCEKRLFLIKNLFLDTPKTKNFLEKIQKITLKKRILIITDILDRNVILASRNVYKIKIITEKHIDPINLINLDTTFIADTVIKKIENQLI
ncbi:50S ribosomal protein L4 [Candidatus Blochmannia ocreatus (nom. nud.)]|uniref:Large ribosomal subunit protein uL4 n=1 Tax=Candidatus Blochmannia ocreatus (nom. nud.) TaxID=251538 RepID=A0ABY4SV18_9ENTR|nr:50S ribosomal protein L4 [Candidatus Blochmannia ocreatus]URJ25269.1 50S ribosomal protein L4 [Candidatus Blochmannia ocreatus]